MGLVVWATLSLGASGAAYAVACTVASRRTTLERLLVAMLLVVATVLAIVMALALAGVCQRAVLAAVAAALEGGAFLWIRARNARSLLVLRLASYDLGAPARVLADARARREIAVLLVLQGAAVVALSAVFAWRTPSWSWDCAWYHAAMTHTVAQSGALRWEPTHVEYVNGYPRAVEMLGVWHELLAGTKRLDDVAQIPFAFLGAAAVAAFCRRLSVPRAMSASLAAAWVALPSVALELHTSHADVAAQSLFLAALYFLTGARLGAFELLAAATALGLYVATKVTGLFHTALLAPLVVVRVLVEALRSREARAPVVKAFAASLVLLVFLGGFTALRNTFHEGNPLWPARVAIPSFHLVLPGTLDPATIADPPAFFGAPGAVQRMVESWYGTADVPFPDIRAGGFGLVFPYLTLPVFAAALVASLLGFLPRALLVTIPVVLLAVVVPAAWWGRFTLAVPAMAFVAFGVVTRRLRSWPLRALLSLALVGLSLAGSVKTRDGYRFLPEAFGPSRALEERVRTLSWMWPLESREAYLRDLRPGDTVLYDAGVGFLDDLWADDLRNRVVYADCALDADRCAASLLQPEVRWLVAGTFGLAAQTATAQVQRFRREFVVGQGAVTVFRRLEERP